MKKVIDLDEEGRILLAKALSDISDDILQNPDRYLFYSSAEHSQKDIWKRDIIITYYKNTGDKNGKL